MPRLFGRNTEVDPKTVYRMESDRVMMAVNGHSSYEHLDLGAEEYVSWQPFTSIFQQTAFESQYGAIVADLARIESRVMFDV